VEVHLLDGTYELFRHYFAVPSHLDDAGIEVAAVRGVLGSVLGMLEQGATHLGVATDHVIESFRNDLWIDYKTGVGIDPLLLAQFPLLEDALRALGVAVWPMVELEADDGLASAVEVARRDGRVTRILVCTPDKDLAQCVEDPLIVQVDRRRDGKVLDEAGVRERFGVGPRSIPDYLALVGDTADGFPGLPGWGAKSAAAVLARYEHLDAIPDDSREWDVQVRGAGSSRPRSQRLVRPRRGFSTWPRCGPTATSGPSTIGCGVDQLPSWAHGQLASVPRTSSIAPHVWRNGGTSDDGNHSTSHEECWTSGFRAAACGHRRLGFADAGDRLVNVAESTGWT